MTWDAFKRWGRDVDDISDAAAHSTVLLMQSAPDTPDVFDFVAESAPVVLSSYALASQDAAMGYVRDAQRGAGLAPSLFEPVPAAITSVALEPVLKWALTDVVFPLVADEVVPRLVQGTTRLVSNVGRETVQQSVGQIDGVYGRRVPRDNACAWCRFMSATQHWDGEWPDSAYHGNCRCRPIIMSPGWDIPDEVEGLWDDYEHQTLDAEQWARKEQTRLDNELWARASAAGGSLSAQKRRHGSLRRRELPTLQQLTLSRLREKYGAR
ncbi:hypothetical protein [Brachybacterium sp. UMB0905]|uniref:VG15 protein n=1 Tax=Brachybacterium sp. UMB0905 TaxID=2069310 RepID=UPI0011AF693A|nr:hypothetical protein [Brachybacterium sp. UMB0905]